MKRMWRNCLAVVALATMAGSVNAQSDWNQPSAIGSYQSILSRAGYGNSMASLGQAMMQPGVPMQGSAMQGSAMQGSAMQGSAMQVGAMAQGSMSRNGAMTNSMPQTATTHGGVMQGGVMHGNTMQSGMVQSGMVQSGMMQGGMSHGGMTKHSLPQSGAIMQGQAVQTAPMTSTPQVGGMASGSFGTPMNSGPIITSTPMTSSSVMSAPVQTAPMTTGNVGSVGVGSGYIDGSSMGSSPIYSGVISGPVSQADCAAPVYSAPVYQPTSYAAPATARGRRARPRSNYTVGVYGLTFERDYEDNRFLARNPSGDTLFTNDADDGSFNGYGVNLASRNAGGGGFEVGYWAFNPGRSVGSLSGANVATNIRGFDRLLHVSSGRDLLDVYSNTVAQTVVREMDINNLEVNLLRNGGTFNTRRNRSGFYELLAGFRYFEFNETLQYTASIDNTVYPLVPSDFFYNLHAENRLLGMQLGARNEVGLGPKLRLFSAVKGGVFNNDIHTLQNLTDANGEIAQVNFGTAAGRPFSYSDDKNDVAFLGELDLGVLYQLSCRARIRVGYRALGVSGVALAADQMPYDYSDPDELLRANSNGSLLLHGGYYGLEFCF